MRQLMHVCVLAGAILLRATLGSAQAPTLAFARPAAGVVVAHDIAYGTDGQTTLRLDTYQLPRASGTRRPALLFFNRGSGADRAGPLYDGWARAAASHGLVGVLADIREGREISDFHAAIDYLTRHGAPLGVDTAGIAVYAASGNVYSAFPFLESADGNGIKAAVIYYGTAPVTQFRLDLPVLWVRAGLDRPDVNAEITRLASLAVTQNAPVTLLNHSTGYHGFELFNDDDATRAVIEQTLAFVRQATAPMFRAALARRSREATAAGAVQVGDFHSAASTYADLVRERPGDSRLGLSYGEALLGDRQYATACALFATLREKGLGRRDLGVPAARACALAGDHDGALSWLRSIPSRFLPPSLATDSAFSAIRERAEFRALFEPRE